MKNLIDKHYLLLLSDSFGILILLVKETLEEAFECNDVQHNAFDFGQAVWLATESESPISWSIENQNG